MVHRMRDNQQAKLLAAHAERRKRLTARLRAEHPSYSDAEIAARLEVFGA
jgi:hypothetical protein